MSDEFGVYLKKLRKANDLTIYRLSKMSCVSHSFITQIEQGKKVPQADITRKLSAALGVSFIGMMIKAGHLTEEEAVSAAKDEVERLRGVLRELKDHVEGQGLLIIQEALGGQS